MNSSRSSICSLTSKKLNVVTLYNLSPYDKKGRDRAQEAARILLLNALKMEPNVHEIFFADTKPNPLYQEIDQTIFSLSNLSTAITADVISRHKDEFRFHTTIRRTEVNKCLNEIYSGLAWKKLGFCLYTLVYPQVVKESSRICFKDFVDNGGNKWAENLLQWLKQPEWTRLIMKRIITGQCSEEQYNIEMNNLFVKFHLLDPAYAIQAYCFLNQQKALPQVHLELVTRNYLGGAFDWTLFKEEISRAIHIPSPFDMSSRLSLDLNDVFYGVKVDEFIVTECRNIGVWNGKRPHNRQVLRLKDRCVLM
ncbi:Hypothetical predicted protein [Octopus vulgaris]|uniref:Uncharacterized protein n=2 Tax=Octopus TaxID=6643 RepID=A0AA36B6N3_OCTVU|nr:uncharacterized protein LOC115215876 [Octopus sinensis]CAI9728881.1 Hypothetical predicted protein [Octopus vulgaris]